MISQTEYLKASETIAQYQLENLSDVFIKIRVESQQGGEEGELIYYDDIQAIAEDMWHFGVQNRSVYSVTQITKLEYDKNHLPF